MKTQIESPHPVLLEVKNLKKHFQIKVPNHETANGARFEWNLLFAS